MRRLLIAALIAVVRTVSANAGDMSVVHLAEDDLVPPGAMQIVSIGQVAVGDYWTYELKDEFSGAVIQRRKVIVTEVSNSEIATRLHDTKTGQSRGIVYDRSWNIVHDWPNRYSPNSGTGFQLPLKLNAQWEASVDEVNRNTGEIWEISVDSRVTSQENVTTKAGTFATYRIETTQIVRHLQNPTEKSEISTRTWFCPDINHWVRRNFVRRENGLVSRNQTFELIDYGRKNTQ
jgi:hypothetical protein